MSDAINAVNLNDAAYDELLKEAETDGRVGDHDALVSSVVHDNWPSGDPRIKIGVVLTTARNAKADLTWSPPPSPEVVKAEKALWEPGKLRAIANAVSMARQLANNYGTSFDKLKEGDTFRVKTAKTKRNDDGTGGFIRIVAILPKTGTAAASPATSPF